MKNKIKNRFISFFKDYYKMVIFFIILFIVVTYPVPYYVFTSGGITDLSDRFEIKDGFTQKGSYNLSYVNQVDGNVLTYLLSSIVPSWDKIEIEKYQYDNESLEELLIRDKLALASANQTAVMLAYSKAGKEIKINNSKIYVDAIYDIFESDKKVKVGDSIKKIENEEKFDFDTIRNLILSKEVGESINITLNRGDEEYNTNIVIKEVNNTKMIGIKLRTLYDFEVDPEITFKFRDSESGPSAGLMTTLAIYDTLIPEDLTKGLKIAGTGTIEQDGTVGEIGGIKYKIAGAESDGADIFFAPSGENFEEAKRIKEERNYKIKVIEVKTIDDAINYLNN